MRRKWWENYCDQARKIPAASSSPPVPSARETIIVPPSIHQSPELIIFWYKQSQSAYKFPFDYCYYDRSLDLTVNFARASLPLKIINSSSSTVPPPPSTSSSQLIYLDVYVCVCVWGGVCFYWRLWGVNSSHSYLWSICRSESLTAQSIRRNA